MVATGSWRDEGNHVRGWTEFQVTPSFGGLSWRFIQVAYSQYDMSLLKNRSGSRAGGALVKMLVRFSMGSDRYQHELLNDGEI